jgi:predicted porin
MNTRYIPPASRRSLPRALKNRPGLLGGLCCLVCLCGQSSYAQDGITIYGRMNVGVAWYGKAAEAPITRLLSLSSRLGVRGSENLGNGLNAIFTIETGISADTGSATLGSREASVGLTGEFGKIRLGFMLNPLDDLHPIAGPGYVTSVTNDNLNGFWANGYSNLFLGGSAGSTACTQVAGPNGNGNSFAFDNRVGNSIRYDSPNRSGWRFATQLGLGEVNACHALVWSNKVQYTDAKLNVALAWQGHKNVRGIDLQDHILMLAAGYQITPGHYLAGWWQTIRYAAIRGQKDLKQDAFGLLWRSKLSQSNELELAWYHAGAGRGSQTPVFSGIFVGPNTQADLFIIGTRHILSKRSELWLQLAQLRNSGQSGYDLGGAGRAGAAGSIGTWPKSVAFGIRHNF